MPKKLKYELNPINYGDENIGERLTRFRKEKGETQASLGQKIGITQSLVSDYENGRAHLSDEMIIRFCEVLQKSADEILGLKKSGESKKMPSLRLMKRLHEIEKLSPSQQKALLKNIDMFIKAAKQE